MALNPYSLLQDSPYADSPSGWHKWPNVVVDGDWASVVGDQERYVMNRDWFEAFIEWLESTERIVGARRENLTGLDLLIAQKEERRLLWRRVVPKYLEAFGPIYPTLTHSEFRTVRRYELPGFPNGWPVTLPTDRVSIKETAFELQQMSIAVGLTFALHREDISALERASLSLTFMGVPQPFVSAAALSMQELVGSPDHPAVATCRFWLRKMATRFPVRVFAAPAADGGFEPVAEGPGHVLWYSLARSSGAINLPSAPLDIPFLSKCAACGKNVFSERPRNRGKRVFCDPPDPNHPHRSCKNRFFARESYKKQMIKQKTDDRLRQSV